MQTIPVTEAEGASLDREFEYINTYLASPSPQGSLPVRYRYILTNYLWQPNCSNVPPNRCSRPCSPPLLPRPIVRGLRERMGRNSMANIRYVQKHLAPESLAPFSGNVAWILILCLIIKYPVLETSRKQGVILKDNMLICTQRTTATRAVKSPLTALRPTAARIP